MTYNTCVCEHGVAVSRIDLLMAQGIGVRQGMRVVADVRPITCALCYPPVNRSDRRRRAKMLRRQQG